MSKRHEGKPPGRGIIPRDPGGSRHELRAPETGACATPTESPMKHPQAEKRREDAFTLAVFLALLLVVAL
jgi:hypothetical protein